MSAAHNLAGMFPPQNEQIWNKDLLWQAIPIHTIASENDYALGMYNTKCPLYEKAYGECEKSDEIQSMLKNHEELIHYLEKHIGRQIENLRQIGALYQTLYVEQLKNFT